VHGGYGINRFGKRGNSSCLGFVQQSRRFCDWRFYFGTVGQNYHNIVDNILNPYFSHLLVAKIVDDDVHH
ncbi:hypothetical protein PWG14_24585, partial [Chromobacterium amazonense]|uniref:hypothetical protein n=1 Tax=Chromobacterium amazonense TaxID=1382803 RepID=UPI00237DAAFD